jgi:YD repeat-containing protein
MYSSKMAARDAGLGYGWGHTFGWEIDVGRRRITVWNEQGIAVDFPMIEAGSEVVGPWGWLLRREEEGFSLDADDGVWRRFSPTSKEGKRHRLTAIEDRNHNRIALTYQNEALVEVVDSAGRTIRVGTTAEGRIASLEVKNAAEQGRWVAFAAYGYDEHGNLLAARDADGFSSRYAYDDEHRLTADTGGGLRSHAYVPNPFAWIDPLGLAFNRQYSLEEVEAMLASSEGRNSPKTGQPGHANDEHVQVPSPKLRKRSCKGTKTSFSSSKSQTKATMEALNSPQGQAELAKLDADPNLVRPDPIHAALSWPVKISKSSKGQRPTREQASGVTVIVDRLPGPGQELHIQTSFGK